MFIKKYVKFGSFVELQNLIASWSVRIPYALKSKNIGILAFLTRLS